MDKKTLHDCITRIKEQDVLIGKYKAYEPKIHQLQQQCKEVEHLNNETKTLTLKLDKKERE